jgi:hypothetical protein
MKSFKINTTNLHKITKFISKVSIECKPILNTIATSKLAETAAFTFDQLYDTDSHQDVSALTKARMNIHARQQQGDNTHFFGLNSEITPLGPRTTLVSFVSPYIDILTHIIEKVAIEENLKLSEFDLKSYSNKTTQRAELIPNFMPKESDLEKHIPSFEERCNHAAHNGCFVKFLDEISDHDRITTRAVEDFKLWLQTDEGSSSLQAALNYCRENLKKTIKNDDL